MFLTFKGQKPAYVSIMDVGRPYKAPVTWETFNVPGRAGVLLVEKTVDPIVIPVQMMVEGSDREEYLRNIEDFSTWLECEKVEPLIFSDDPYRTYYAVTQGDVKPDDELNIYGVVTINFFIPYPYKFGIEKNSTFIDGVASVFNSGSIPVRPTIYAEVLEDITHLDILGQGKYLRVGEPANLNESISEPETLRFHSTMSGTTGWTSAGTSVNGGTVTGSFGSVNSEFYVIDWGSGPTGYIGPALKQSVPNGPLADFKVEFRFRFPTHTGQRGRTELYLLNDQNVEIGKLAMKMTNRTSGNTVEVRIGGGTTFTFPVLYAGGPNGTEWNNFAGIIRLSKKGNVYESYIAKIAPSTGRHQAPHHSRFVDEEFKYGGTLSQVQIHTGRSGTLPAIDARISDIKVYQLNEVPDADPRIIARAGDLIEINFEESAIYINGEEKRELKDVFSTFFSLPRGVSQLAIDPVTKVNAVAQIREGFQ